MELGVNCLLMCLFVGLLIHSQGLQFTLDSIPNTFYCGHLNCSGDVNQNDPRILSVVGLTISSIVQPNTLIKLASISVFDPIPQVEPTKINDLNATGSVSRYHGNLNLSLRNKTDCLMTSFLCQLDFVNVSGQSDNIREVVTPADTTNCPDISKQIANFSDQLQKYSDDVDKKLTNIDGQLTDVATKLTQASGKLTDMDVKLTDVNGNLTGLIIQNTAMDVKLIDVDGTLTELKSHNTVMDGKVTDLKIQNTAINGNLTDVGGKLTDIKAQNTAMDGKLTDVKAQNTDVNLKLTAMDGKLTELKTQNTATEQELIKLKDQNVAMETKLDSVLVYLARLEVMINSSQPAVDTVSCVRGAPHDEPREKILLWGRVPALCDTETDGGGWVIIQRRTTGDVDFYRGWDDYKKGFGTPDTDFWLGNDNIHNMTSHGYTTLRVDMESRGVNYFAAYSNFGLTDEFSKYKLTVSGYDGNTYDALSQQNDMYFSTYDRDNDQYPGVNCAAADQYHGGWWYRSCTFSNLNGDWGAQDYRGLSWYGIVDPGSVTWSEMKIRQV